MRKDFCIGSILDQAVGGECQRIGNAACLAGGDRNVGAIGPAGAQRSNPFEILVAGGDIDELGMRLDDDIGTA